MAGCVVWQGPSKLTGAPIVAILTGRDGGSENRKTGGLSQLWILSADQHPVLARRSGADEAVCGDCPLRSGGCYVSLGFAPAAVWRAFRRGSYSIMDPADAGCGQLIRLGAYGDPAAVPVHVLCQLVSESTGWTGYSHQWRTAEPQLRSLCMASVESPADAAEAQAAGWRTFRIMAPGTRPASGEMCCPASVQDSAVTCAQCRACSGTVSRRPSVCITAHGAGAGKVRAQ